jgi:hypothetical protein
LLEKQLTSLKKGLMFFEKGLTFFQKTLDFFRFFHPPILVNLFWFFTKDTKKPWGSLHLARKIVFFDLARMAYMRSLVRVVDFKLKIPPEKCEKR